MFNKFNYLGTEETGGDPIAIRWYKDNKLIANSDNPVASSVEPDRIRIWPNGSLEVTPVLYDDTGEYMCEVVRMPPWGSKTQMHAIEVLCKYDILNSEIKGCAFYFSH